MLANSTGFGSPSPGRFCCYHSRVQFSDDERAFLVKAACLTVRRRLEGVATIPKINPVPAAASQLAGCFVSLHSREKHALRGCVGRIDSSMPLIDALLGAAWQVTQDPRFAATPVMIGELPLMTIELSILGMLRPAPTPTAFSPQDDGLYLIVSGRAGVFLPQVARETGWSKEQLLDRLCVEKIGMPPKSWQGSGSHLFTFPSVTIGPTDFVS
jgi:AmmeMemoRadiSam system protein A